MPMGRPPHPIKLLEQNGTAQQHAGKYRHRKHEPKSDGSIRRPPGLGKVAAKKFDELRSHIEGLGIADKTDVHLLTQYAEIYEQYTEALASVKETGLALVSRNADGSVRIQSNPYQRLVNDLRTQMFKLLSEIGFTPVARTRVARETSFEKNPLQELRQRRA